MPHPPSSIALGSPRFAIPALAALHTSQGALRAWEAAFADGAKGAASQVTGDFAVGLQDAAGRTFLAVDRFAICSLCYRVSNGRIEFAARADDLADTSTEIDPQAIFDYLYFHVIPSPRTIYKGILRLPPGHYALFEDGVLTVAPYWSARFQEGDMQSFASAKAEFLGLLRGSVSGQLGKGKPACFLSGGTDSSTVAGMAAQASGQTVSTYSIGFDAQGYDEMAFARIAAQHFKTDHHEYYVTPDDLVRSIAGVAGHFDQPFGNSSALPAYYCARMARDDGVTKLLAGDGGDELFGGNSRYAKQRVFGFYQNIPSVVRRHLVEPVLGMRAAASIALGRKARSYVEQARVPMPDRLQMYNLITRLGVGEVLTPQLLAQVDIGLPLQGQREVWHAAGQCSELNRELAFDWRYTLAECDLPKVVGTTGYAGVDVGFPMLNDQLLEFSQRLPSGYKLKQLQLRWFFKEALKGFLPDEILKKKKQGFGLPFGVWANTHTELKSLARDSLSSLAARGVVRKDFVLSLMQTKLPEHPGYYGEMVWILMMLEQWLVKWRPDYKVAT
jgi:asparagine synthase (glutamine-hydrolysing)